MLRAKKIFSHATFGTRAIGSSAVHYNDLEINEGQCFDRPPVQIISVGHHHHDHHHHHHGHKMGILPII
jgi:hypothetical protein